MAKQCKAKECNNAVFSKGYCKRHQYMRKDNAFKRSLEKHRETFNKKTSISPRSKKKSIYTNLCNYERQYGYKSQIELFEDIWNNRKPYSFISGKSLKDFENSELWLNLFAHVLPKGKYPEMKYNPDNIVLLHPVEHNLYDKGTAKRRRDYQEYHPECDWKKLYQYRRELLEKLNNKYAETK